LLALSEVVQANPGDACTTSCQRFETLYRGFDRPDRFIRLSDILPLVHLLSGPPYVSEEAGTHRYNVGTETPKLWATSFGGVPLAHSFLAA
jgi:hypothetical protein